MSNFFKRIISVTLALLTIFGLAFTPEMAAMMTANAATQYNLWVNGEQFTSDKLTITCGTGTAVYDPVSTTLTLNSAVITKADADGGAVCAVNISSLTIRLNGTSVITAPGDDAISVLSGTVSIEDGPDAGIGALTATASSYAVYAGGNVNIRGGRLDLSAKSNYGCAVKATGNVNITDGTIKLSSPSEGNHIDASKVVITGGSVSASADAFSSAPVNGGGTAVVLTEHTIPSITTATQVGTLKVTLNGSLYAYGISSVFTDDTGKLKLWLPAGAVISEASVTSSTASTSSSTSSTTSSSTSSTASNVPPYVRLTGNNVNFRASAPSGSVIDMLPIFACYPCSAVTKIGSNTWYKIKVGSDEGWIIDTFATPETDGTYIQMTGNNVNVRTSAPSGRVIDTVRENACYKYSETKNVSGTTWYKIPLGTVSGWVSGTYCKVISSGTTGSSSSSGGATSATSATSSAPSSGYLRITGTNINVRRTAGSTDSSDVMTKVNKNAWYPFTETKQINNSTWYKITIGDEYGWIIGTYASVATEAANYVKITGTNINVRTKAGTGDIIGTVTLNEYYPYTETTSLGGTTCYKITIGSTSGWIVGTYAEAVGGSGSGGSGTQTTATTAPTAPPALAKKDYVQATAGAVNVRNAAQGGTVVTTITEEMKYGWFKYASTNTIAGVTWYQITIGSTIGWVSGSYVKPATTAAKYIKITSNLVNVRNEPNGSDIVAQVPRHCSYPFTETKTVDNTLWYKISIGSTSGWINSNFVTLADPDTSATTSTASSTTSTTTTTTTAIAGTTRLEGKSRIDTAISISKEGWKSGSENVIIAYSHNYADALAGVSLAGALNAPILLTSNGSTLEPALAAELERLGAKKIYILGGSMVISNTIADSLSAKYTVKRIAGSNRYETAVEIAKELRNVTGKDFTTLYFANATNFPDALSISPVAAIQGNPVLYAPSTGALDSATANYVKSLSCTNAVIVGGPLAINDDVRNSIITNGISSVARIYGTSRYDTSLKINSTYNTLFTGKGIAISTGKDFPDALAGGALAASSKIPVILIDSKANVSGLKDYIKTRGYEPAYIFGGPLAVANDTVIGIIR